MPSSYKTSKEFDRILDKLQKKDKQLYENIAQNAKQIADSGFRWEPISKKLETLYQSLIDEQKK